MVNGWIKINNMRQQTAVEFLVELLPQIDWDDPYYRGILQEAKQMEKEQLVKAWDDGDYAYFYSKETGRDFDNGEQYYNETYKK
jgi:hypothetical protein